jgi:hypothetical protein
MTEQKRLHAESTKVTESAETAGLVFWWPPITARHGTQTLLS